MQSKRSRLPPSNPRATNLVVHRRRFDLLLEDGRTLSVPFEWFPRLRGATRAQLTMWRLIGEGVSIHWPALDEDLFVKGLLMPADPLRPAGGS
ncbi:MAG: DUF2442 domain-containing protein [Myxococcaceae bacterium]